MITRLTLDNLKAHGHTDIDLSRFTVLVGPNGSGKTTVLEALDVMCHFPQRAMNVSPSRPLLPRAGVTEPIRVAVAATEGAVRWTATFTSPTNEYRPTTDQPGRLVTWPWCRLFRFDAEKIGQPSYSDEQAPEVDADGGHTASALAALKLADDQAFSSVVAALTAIVPTLREVRLRPRQAPRGKEYGAQTANGHQIFLDFAGAPNVAAPQASAGTLVALALLTALAPSGPERARLALIDDIDQSLHPAAQAALMRQLHALLERDPGLQIVATTHSPYILDGIAPENVWVFFPRENGEIAYRKLSEHPDAQRAKGELSTGEIWTLDPESWVVETAPRP